MITSAVKLHVRLDGRSFDIPLSDLDLGTHSSDQEIKNRLANYLDLPSTHLVEHVVDRHRNGNLTLRPNAVYG